MATNHQSLVSEFKNQIGSDGDLLHSLAQVCLRALMEEEVQAHVGAGLHERSSSRQGRRNGYKPRRLKTRVGELELSVPQVRGMEPYQPSVLARYQRSERALLAACAEMYFMGVSTRKVGAVLEKMGGFELSAGTVSRVAEEMASRWEAKCPGLARLLREGFDDCMTVHRLPGRLRRRLHSTNMAERVMREIKRRTNAVGIFPNEAACDRLIGAHLVERHETWLCDRKRYLDLDGRESL